MSAAYTPETRIAAALVTALLRDGGTVSVFDGEEWTVSKSTNAAQINAALGTTDFDVIRVRNTKGDTLGEFRLIWGNATDGSELIADHIGNDFCNAIVAEVEAAV